jgi:hypothetical protein
MTFGFGNILFEYINGYLWGLVLATSIPGFIIFLIWFFEEKEK